MARKKIERTEEEIKKLRQQYYQYHRTEILQKAKERRAKPSNDNIPIRTDSALQELLNEWNEQLSSKLEENVSEWLKIGFRDQIEINKAMLTNQE
jgi:hypothetical protein